MGRCRLTGPETPCKKCATPTRNSTGYCLAPKCRHELELLQKASYRSRHPSVKGDRYGTIFLYGNTPSQATCAAPKRKRFKGLNEWKREKFLKGMSTDANKCSTIDLQANIGSFDEDVLEFIYAVDKAKKGLKRSLKTSEIFQVVLSLGYKKCSP